MIGTTIALISLICGLFICVLLHKKCVEVQRNKDLIELLFNELNAKSKKQYTPNEIRESFGLAPITETIKSHFKGEK